MAVISEAYAYALCSGGRSRQGGAGSLDHAEEGGGERRSEDS